MTPRRPFYPVVSGVVMACSLLMGCSSGPFTKPARVVLYEDRSGGATAAPSPRPAAVRPVPAARDQRSAAAGASRAAAYSGVHTVRGGETVYSVASLYRASIRGVIELNGLRAPYVLRPGQTLRIPVPRDHIVQPGDTLYGISRRYGVAMNALVRQNAIPAPYRIIVGRKLRLPEPVRTASVAPATAQPASRPPPAVRREGKPPATTTTAAVARPPPAKPRINPAVPKPPARSGRTFLLPVRGKILSAFGSKGRGLHNDGVNIAAARGTPVRAAENGIVVYSGNALLGFGNMVLIRHADGYMTAYAHNDTLGVQRGDTVRRGQVIATVGSSGSVSTPQLHFEVRKGKSAVNPAKFLPGLARR